jgi:peptidoglycan/xylan/chitin deacetylase (PgdA/CDA1 family)
MRFVISIVAALVILGLAAFGVVLAQRMSAAPSQAVASDSAPVAAPQPAPVAARRHPVNPVSQIAQTATDSAPVASAEPIRLAQATQTTPAAAPSSTAPNAAPQPKPSNATAIPPCDKPGGMGLARIVEIDTTGGPGFGFEHFKQYDFLRDKEVVFTFDDGPWPGNTPKVIKALTDNCTKATFFEIGEHATWAPEITKEVIAAGMTVGTHTWSHKDLAKNPYAKDIEQAKAEIEMGVSAVHMAADSPIAPFFRFPDLQQPPELLTYLGTRNIATFSADIDTVDFKLTKPEAVIKSVMTKLAKNGKGILLMHDFRPATADAMPELLQQLKAAGYKVVHMIPKAPVTTLSQYDDMVRAKDKFSNANNTRPQSSVVKTISE